MESLIYVNAKTNSLNTKRTELIFSCSVRMNRNRKKSCDIYYDLIMWENLYLILKTGINEKERAQERKNSHISGPFISCLSSSLSTLLMRLNFACYMHKHTHLLPLKREREREEREKGLLSNVQT